MKEPKSGSPSEPVLWFPKYHNHRGKRLCFIHVAVSLRRKTSSTLEYSLPVPSLWKEKRGRLLWTLKGLQRIIPFRKLQVESSPIILALRISIFTSADKLCLSLPFNVRSARSSFSMPLLLQLLQKQWHSFCFPFWPPTVTYGWELIDSIH